MESISCCLCPFSANSESILDMHIKKEHENIFSKANFSLAPGPEKSKRSKKKVAQSTPKMPNECADDGRLSSEFQSTPDIKEDESKIGRSSTTSSNSSDSSASGNSSILDSTISLLSNKSFSCNDCVFVASTYYALRKHRAENHTNEADVKEMLNCKNCDFVGQSFYFLKKHRAEMHQNGSKKEGTPETTSEDSDSPKSFNNSPQPNTEIERVKSSGKRGRPKKALVEASSAPSEDSTEAKKPKMEPAQRAKRKSLKVVKRESFEQANDVEVVSTVAEEKSVASVAEEKNLLAAADVKVVDDQENPSEEIPNYLGLVRSSPADNKEESLAILVKLQEQMKGAKTTSKFIEAVSGLINTFNNILMKEESAKSKLDQENKVELAQVKKENESLKKELQAMAFTHSETEMDLKKKILDLEAALAEKSSTISDLEVELDQVKKEEQGLIDSAKHFLSRIQSLEQKK